MDGLNSWSNRRDFSFWHGSLNSGGTRFSRCLRQLLITTMSWKIRKLPGRNRVFTTGIVSRKEGLKIALFFSGRKHAGKFCGCVGPSEPSNDPPDSNVRCLAAQSSWRTEAHSCERSRARPASLRRSGGRFFLWNADTFWNCWARFSTTTPSCANRP